MTKDDDDGSLVAIQVRVPKADIPRIDELRRLEDDFPSRGEVCRRVIMRAVEARERAKGKREGK